MLLALLLSAAAHAQAEDDDARRAAIDDILAEHPVYQNAAPRILQGAKREQERTPVPATDNAPGVLQSGDLAAWPRLWREDSLLVTGSLTGTVALFGMRNNAFAPPPSVSTAPRHPQWGEAFLEPGIAVHYGARTGWSAYGSLSYMETTTRGTDYASVADTWHGSAELAFAGLRYADGGRALDVSYGRQDVALGSDLLIAAGATNGVERGANYLGPRSAWANALVAKATADDWTLEGFWLKPNEAAAVATGTRLAGVDVALGGSGALNAGFTWVRAIRSDIVTRDGLDVYSVRATWKAPLARRDWTLQGEYVLERKPGVAADGWYVEASWHPPWLAWQPIAMLRYSSFSGDRPGTATWEGFDPLYYGGSTPDWYQGKIGSTLFANTNLDTLVASLTLAPNERNILQFLYLDYRAAQANAPLVLPPPNGPLPTGDVPAKALAQEFDAIYTFTFDKSANVNVFVGYATPGAGYRQLYEADGGTARGWWMLGTQFNISY